jgi:hypothetical protein
MNKTIAVTSADATLSRRPARRFWGWGRADATLDAREQATGAGDGRQVGAKYIEQPARERSSC